MRSIMRLCPIHCATMKPAAAMGLLLIAACASAALDDGPQPLAADHHNPDDAALAEHVKVRVAAAR